MIVVRKLWLYKKENIVQFWVGTLAAKGSLTRILEEQLHQHVQKGGGTPAFKLL